MATLVGATLVVAPWAKRAPATSAFTRVCDALRGAPTYRVP